MTRRKASFSDFSQVFLQQNTFDKSHVYQLYTIQARSRRQESRHKRKSTLLRASTFGGWRKATHELVGRRDPVSAG